MATLFGIFERLAAAARGETALTLTETGLMAVAGLLVACLVILVVVLRRSGGGVARALEPRLDALADGQERSERALRDELARNRSEQADAAQRLREELGVTFRDLGDGVDKRLETIRATVDEKLQGTLEKRLGEAFSQVSRRLEAVHEGLGEMRNLATGVGDLKKVLTNVKSRGTWGEIQLGSLLEQILSAEQYARNVATRPGGSERVEFAIRLPGAKDDGDPVWLPIDAKFPQEDYHRLVEAQEQGDAGAAETAGRALETRVKQEARRIRDKYLNPPVTTDFALLFLPTEGLYAEVLRRPGLAEQLQREQRVTIAGPTTLAALLNSLQMGFRSLAIQKRSSEVWKLLGAVKTQFGQFSGLLAKVEKKLEEASATIGDASRKTRTIERRLGKVQELPSGESLAPADEEPG